MSNCGKTPQAPTVQMVFSFLSRGYLTRDFFDGFVEGMRKNPVLMDVIEIDLHRIFLDANLQEDAEPSEYEERNKEFIDESCMDVIKTPEYQQLSQDVFHWFEVNTRQFEANFVAGISRLDCTVILGAMSKQERLVELVGFPLDALPNLPTCRFISIFLQSRPEGYFQDAELDYKQTARLKAAIGDRVVDECKRNLSMVGHAFSMDIGV